MLASLSTVSPTLGTLSLCHLTFIIAPPRAVFFFLSGVLLQSSTPKWSLVTWKQRVPPRSGNSSIIQLGICLGCFSCCFNDTYDMSRLRKPLRPYFGSQLHRTVHQVSEDVRQLAGHNQEAEEWMHVISFTFSWLFSPEPRVESGAVHV